MASPAWASHEGSWGSGTVWSSRGPGTGISRQDLGSKPWWWRSGNGPSRSHQNLLSPCLGLEGMAQIHEIVIPGMVWGYAEKLRRMDETLLITVTRVSSTGQHGIHGRLRMSVGVLRRLSVHCRRHRVQTTYFDKRRRIIENLISWSSCECRWTSAEVLALPGGLLSAALEPL
ncbi:hypothetical protein RRG08_031294 [Elysia crispata]|uniref:Uncharacterized protein n=1 Tax=Elysia crispata TaxID=231223 RepID=A0AAE1E0R7_9GAST|nr:hypothetical protein RRG08_031294 [Elysia crispata]